jgi:hypothetical protein
MAAILVVSPFLLLPAASQTPDPGWFVMYTDARLVQCWIEPVAGPVTVYVVSQWGSGIGGARFRLVPDPDLHWEYVGEQVPGFMWWIRSWVGNAREGIVLDGGWGGYPTVLLEVNYLATAAPESCARLRIEPYPGSEAGTAEVSVVENQWAVPTFVYDLPVGIWCSPWCVLGTPVESRTWGAIKALYR